MSYYIKKNGTEYDDKNNPLKEVWKGKRYEGPEKHYFDEQHAPWYALKDGTYLMCEPELDYNTHKVIGYSNVQPYIPIMSYTISSLSGMYEISDIEEDYYSSYKVPGNTGLTYELSRLYVKDKCDIGKSFNSETTTQLSWKISDENLKYYNYLNRGPTLERYDTTTDNCFKAQFSAKNFKFFDHEFEMLYKPDPKPKANVKDHLWFINNEPKVEDGKFNYTQHLNTSTDLTSKIPPYFTLDVPEIKQKYNQLKITYSAVCLYCNGGFELINRDTDINVDTNFIQNICSIPEDSPYCFHFCYQFANENTWNTASNVNMTYALYPSDDNPDGSFGPYGIEASDYFTPITVKHMVEEHNPSDGNFWTHVIPLKITPPKTIYRIKNYAGGIYYAWPGYASAAEGSFANEFEPIKIDYKNKLDIEEFKPIGENDEAIAYLSSCYHFNSASNTAQPFQPAGWTLGLNDIWDYCDPGNNNHLDAVTWTNDMVSGCTPTANVIYTHSIVTGYFTINLTDNTNKYLHITYPGTTLFKDVGGGGYRDGLIQQLYVNYEGLTTK